MQKFLKDFSVTKAQWAMLEAIVSVLQAQSEFNRCAVPPCITFKQVDEHFEPVTPGDELSYDYEITRYVGKGYFYTIGNENKIPLIVSCEETYGNFLPRTWGDSYLYKIYVAFCLPSGEQRVVKMDSLYRGDQVLVNTETEELPTEIKKMFEKVEATNS